MDGLSVKRNQDLGLAVLQQTLTTNGYASKRSFRSPEEFQIYFQKHKTLIVDATEQLIQCPKTSAYQELMYSGKKSHTVKAMIIITPDRYAHYVSQCWVGKVMIIVCSNMNFHLSRIGLKTIEFD